MTDSDIVASDVNGKEETLPAIIKPATTMKVRSRHRCEPCNGDKYRYAYGNPVHPDIISSLKADYMTGQYHSLALAEKHGRHRNSAQYFIARGKWKDELKKLGIPVPLEPPPQYVKKYPTTTFDLAQADFISGNYSIFELCQKYNVTYHYMAQKARDGKWRDKRAVHMKRIDKTQKVITRMERVNELSESFCDSALRVLRKAVARAEQMDSGDVEVTVANVERLIKSFSSLYETVKKIPAITIPKLTPAVEAVAKAKEDGTMPLPPKPDKTHMAHLPAPVLKVVKPEGAA